MKKNIKKLYTPLFYMKIIVLLFFCFAESGCKKFIEVEAPITSVNGGNVYTDDANAIAAITGIYAKMSNTGFSLNFSIYPELSADNFTLFTTLQDLNYTLYFQNALNSLYTNSPQFWDDEYNFIYTSNAAISGLSVTNSLTPAIKQRLLGEAYFIRAFHYFYLVNLYGDVPLVLSTNYIDNSKLSKTPIASVYQQMISDLNQAKSLLDDQYVDASILRKTTERLRPNRMAVNALLARVQLFVKNYAAADAASTEVINKTDLYSARIPLNQVFLKNSMETIWALQPMRFEFSTDEANLYIPSESIGPVYLSASFLGSFEMGDLRRSTWIGELVFDMYDYPYPAKYKALYGSSTLTEYSIVLRLAEQYLIRAEARAKLNDISGSQSDLNEIRHRAGLPNTSANTTEDLLTAILKERRIELFSEWGHRWLDLKRTDLINSVMQKEAPFKGATWQPYMELYPIPYADIKVNSNLTQNTGY
ncbi:RagB/SusD family nutrient uptake outer membrane protein [Chitinophaga oryziterrae]|nr:RagB/SusD family nutrient uptake outer membrane protein [Chitinophaga oryziterrae]